MYILEIGLNENISNWVFFNYYYIRPLFILSDIVRSFVAIKSAIGIG